MGKNSPSGSTTNVGTSNTTSTNTPFNASFLGDIYNAARGQYAGGPSAFQTRLYNGGGNSATNFFNGQYNPYTQEAGQNLYDLMGALGQNQNPALSPMLGLSGTAATGNPALSMLENTAQGNYLNNNPYVDKMFGQAANAVEGQLNSQFDVNGRGGSGANQVAMGNTLNNLATDIYGGNYANERQLQQAAQGTLGRQWLGGIGEALQGYGQAGNQWLGQVGLGSQDAAELAQMGQGVNQTGLGYAGLTPQLSALPWQNLNEYASLVGSAIPGTVTQSGTTTGSSPYFNNPLGSAVGLASSLFSPGKNGGPSLFGNITSGIGSLFGQ